MTAVQNTIVYIGQKSAWFNFFLVVLICFDVVQRYFFGLSYNWIIELEWHFFGLIFILGSAYTMSEDKHVRVDVFYHYLSTKNKAMVDVVATLILFIPWCLICIKTCYTYASNSFYIHEASPSPGGLSAWYVIKFLVVIGFVLLLLQGLVMVFQKLKKVFQ